MKKILFSLVAIMIAMVSFAQTSLLATLSHDGSISTFYGKMALKEAIEKADNGDVITLSAGQFNATDITKAITLRGAGMRVNADSIDRHEQTIIRGNFKIAITDSIPERLMFEGLYFDGALYNTGTLNNALFMKSRFYSITDNGKITNSTFIHCRVANGFNLATHVSNVNLVNCIINNAQNTKTNNGSLTSYFNFENCIVTPYSYYLYYSNFKNSIILYNNYDITNTNYNNVINYCLRVGTSSTFSGTNNNATNKSVKDYTSVFKTQNAAPYTENSMYELTDDAKSKYLGMDGKEVGIYGGNIPYEEDPITPKITKCNVASKSTADGKLSIDIEVSAAKY